MTLEFIGLKKEKKIVKKQSVPLHEGVILGAFCL